MKIDDFIFDVTNQKVSWSYNGQAIVIRHEEMIFASVSNEKDFLYIECGKDFIYDIRYIYNPEGQLEFCINKKEGIVQWKSQDGMTELTQQGIDDAKLYPSSNIVVAISFDENIQRLTVYDLRGSVISEKILGDDLNFMYLSELKGLPSVVCTNNFPDQYGRNSWHFLVTPHTGELTKAGVAY